MDKKRKINRGYGSQGLGQITQEQQQLSSLKVLEHGACLTDNILKNERGEMGLEEESKRKGGPQEWGGLQVMVQGVYAT